MTRRPLRALVTTLLGALLWLASGIAPALEPTGPDATAAPPGEIRFVARNAIANAEGIFHRWRIVTARADPRDPEAGLVEVEVDVDSLDTGIGRRDAHLRTADFFDTERWPLARVRVHDVRRIEAEGSSPDRYTAQFEVTIRDVTRTVQGEFELVSQSPPRVEGELVLDRMDFGIGKPHSRWNPLSIRQQVPVEFTATLPAARP